MTRSAQSTDHDRNVPALTLNNGVTMPALGYGVFQTPPDETITAVETALQHGLPAHRHRRGVRQRARRWARRSQRSGLDRGEVFVETKVWISDYGYDATLHAFDKSAGKLGLDQIDLLILHQPMPSQFDLTLEAYRALETPAGGRQGPRHRRQQLHARPPGPPGRGHLGDPGGQPDRGPPLLPPARRRSPRTPSAASCPRPGPPSAGSPSTATAARDPPCRTRPSSRSPRPTAGRRPR